MRTSGAHGSPTGFFEELYAVVVGLGLAIAVEGVVDLGRDGIPITFEQLPVFLAYLNIAFALAHASVRYLQLAYTGSAFGMLGRGRVIGDLVLGVGHFLWLIGLSFLISRPVAFLWGAIILLLGRPIRDLLLMGARRERLDFDRKVFFVHLVAIGTIAVSLAATLVVTGATEIWLLRIGALVASIVFGLGLYLVAFDFFFPANEEAPSDS